MVRKVLRKTVVAAKKEKSQLEVGGVTIDITKSVEEESNGLMDKGRERRCRS